MLTLSNVSCLFTLSNVSCFNTFSNVSCLFTIWNTVLQYIQMQYCFYNFPSSVWLEMSDDKKPKKCFSLCIFVDGIVAFISFFRSYRKCKSLGMENGAAILPNSLMNRSINHMWNWSGAAGAAIVIIFGDFSFQTSQTSKVLNF